MTRFEPVTLWDTAISCKGHSHIFSYICNFTVKNRHQETTIVIRNYNIFKKLQNFMQNYKKYKKSQTVIENQKQWIAGNHTFSHKSLHVT